MPAAPSPLTDTVSARLSDLVLTGAVIADPLQAGIAARLDRVLADIASAAATGKASALGWLFAARRRPQRPVTGLYIHGSVGRGKTMLMDLFFDTVPIRAKRRAHFHEFMADVHGRIHAQRLAFKEGRSKQSDPVPPVAQSLIDEATLLCFDEFAVTDIADAMILGRLFSELFARGAVLVATSNVDPDDLYKDGLNRSLFIPFIRTLKTHVEVASLDSMTDYRLEKLERLPVWMTPRDARTEAAFEAAWAEAIAGKTARPETIGFRGRQIQVPLAAGRTARFAFRDLCETPLAAADYLALCDRYDTVFVSGIPVLTPEKRNETKRFINLVDTLYDRGKLLFASADADPSALLPVRKGTEGFEFDRTVSRLFEMGSADYRRAHRG